MLVLNQSPRQNIIKVFWRAVIKKPMRANKEELEATVGLMEILQR